MLRLLRGHFGRVTKPRGIQKEIDEPDARIGVLDLEATLRGREFEFGFARKPRGEFSHRAIGRGAERFRRRNGAVDHVGRTIRMSKRGAQKRGSRGIAVSLGDLRECLQEFLAACARFWAE